MRNLNDAVVNSPKKFLRDSVGRPEHPLIPTHPFPRGSRCPQVLAHDQSQLQPSWNGTYIRSCYSSAFPTPSSSIESEADDTCCRVSTLD